MFTLAQSFEVAVEVFTVISRDYTPRNYYFFLSSNIKEIVINSYAHSIVSHDHLFCFRYLTHPVLTKEMASCVGFLPPAIEKSA